jgi:phenylacetate-CoA ligase
MEKIDVSIVIPCFNEEINVPIMIARATKSLDEEGLSFQIIVVDDGSTDSTLEVLHKLARTNLKLQVVSNLHNEGIVSSWQKGAFHAIGEYIALIDADLQNQPEDIYRLVLSLRTRSAHFVQGYRSSIERQKDFRFIYSRMLNFMLNFLFRDHATDNKSGFVVGRRLEFISVLKILSESNLFYPQTFLRVVIKKLNYSIDEIETLFLARKAGVSFLEGPKTIKAILLSIFYDLPFALFKFQKGKLENVGTNRFKKGFYDSEVSIYSHLGLRSLIAIFYFKTMIFHKWLIRSSAYKLYKQLIYTQYLDRASLQRLQLKRLNLLFSHVESKVPYYSKIFDANQLPTTITSIENLEDFPLLAKEDVLENTYFDLFSVDHNKKAMLKISTSGSSGMPFTTYADKFQLEMRFATTLRQMEWTGWRFGHRQVRLWHQKIGMTRLQAFKEKLDALILRRTFIPAFEITPDNIHSVLRKISKSRPVLLDGYAESLNFLSLYLTSQKINIHPKAVMSSAQLLPKQVREIIERELDTTVYDKYGSREFSGIAYQCGYSPNYHVMDESYIVEILVNGRRAKPGELGEVVITDLNNYSFPLIRYRVGDLAIAVEQVDCPCGRKLSQIGPIQGRTQAIVHCSNGVWMPGTFFAHFFKDYDSIIRHFQIYQEKLGSFDLYLVKSDLFSELGFASMMKQLQKFVGSTGIDTKFVESIPLLATGKRSPVISKIKLDFQIIDEQGKYK